MKDLTQLEELKNFVVFTHGLQKGIAENYEDIKRYFPNIKRFENDLKQLDEGENLLNRIIGIRPDNWETSQAARNSYSKDVKNILKGCARKAFRNVNKEENRYLNYFISYLEVRFIYTAKFARLDQAIEKHIEII